MAIGGFTLGAVLLVIVLSFSFKIAYYAGPQRAALEIGRARLEQMFTRHGFAPAGAAVLSAEQSDVVIMTFNGPFCTGPVRTAALPVSRAVDQLVAQSLNPGERLFFVYGGGVVAQAPASAPLTERLSLWADRLGFASLVTLDSYAAVMEPEACHLEDWLPWGELLQEAR